MTIRAAVRGVIDFRDAQIMDVKWWRRTNILIQEMAREDDLRVSESILRRYCAYVANGWLEDASFKNFQEKAQQTCARLIELAYPWTAAESTKTDVIEDLTALYNREVGNPSDPEFMARVAEGVRKHQEEEQRIAAETDEQRVARRLREKDLPR